MSTWQALADWIQTDLGHYLGADVQETTPVVTVTEETLAKVGDWAGWDLPAICIISSTWRPANPAHGAGGYVYDRVYEFRLAAITRGERAAAIADARTILERIETRAKGWNGQRNAITLAGTDAAQSFGVSRGGLETYHTQSSTMTAGRYAVAGLVISARVVTR